MKKYIYQLGLAALLLNLVACADYLDLAPESNLVEEEYFTNDSEVENGVISLYNQLQQVVMPQIQLSELRSDNISPANLEGEWAAVENFNETSTNDFITVFWSTAYATIARANIVLKYLANVRDNTKRDRFEGEAKFLRAMMLFDLVRFYGEVPVPTQPLAYNATEEVKRREVSVVYQQIISDLKDAEAKLPLEWDAANIGRATKGAAQTLLAKVYLTQKDYASAKTLLEAVINGKKYSLQAKYLDVFSVEMNPEVIFAIRYRTASNGEGQGFSFDFSKDGATRGLKPLADMQALYLKEDTRYAASITGTGTQAFVNKFPDAAKTGNRRDSGTDWIVLRYADVVLMYAEVLNELGDLSKALPLVNSIRKRAGVPEYKTDELKDKVTFQSALEKERRLELAFENQRWFDLLRWGKAVSAMTEHFAAIKRTNVTVAEFRVRYPVPQREIDLSKGLLTQNPGHN